MVLTKLRRPAVGLTLFAALLLTGLARAEKQTDLSLRSPPQSQVAQHYTVGDVVPSSVRFDDDGFPDRPYALLIVDGAVVVVIDRVTRRVVEVLR